MQGFYIPEDIIYFIQYISVYSATYYCLISFSQQVSAVHGHHEVSNSLILLHCMLCPHFHITCECDTSYFKINGHVIWKVGHNIQCNNFSELETPRDGRVWPKHARGKGTKISCIVHENILYEHINATGCFNTTLPRRYNSSVKLKLFLSYLRTTPWRRMKCRYNTTHS
jgi:hypothetical protein